MFQHLANITAKQAGAAKGEYDDIPYLKFTKAGQAVFDDWYTDLMQRIRLAPRGEQGEYQKDEGIFPATFEQTGWIWEEVLDSEFYPE